MILFEFLFIALVLTTLVTVILIVINALRGRFRQAAKLLARYGLGLALYLVIVAVVGVLAPQRVVAFSEDRCFDDWCVAVVDVVLAQELGQGEQAIQTNGTFYIITLRLSNHARGREQRASSAAIHLLDGKGRVYDISPQGQAAFVAQNGSVAPLTSLLSVGQSLDTIQIFDLPPDAQNISLTIEHPVGFSPGLLVIGDEASLLHKPTIVRLP